MLNCCSRWIILKTLQNFRLEEADLDVISFAPFDATFDLILEYVKLEFYFMLPGFKHENKWFPIFAEEDVALVSHWGCRRSFHRYVTL